MLGRGTRSRCLGSAKRTHKDRGLDPAARRFGFVRGLARRRVGGRKRFCRVVLQLAIDGAQHPEVRLQRIEAPQQRLDLLRSYGFCVERFDGRFEAVGHFAKPHRTRKTRASFERVQCPQYLAARTQVLGASGPLTQSAAQMRQQLGRLFLENRKEVGVDDVQIIDVVVEIRPKTHGSGDCVIDLLLPIAHWDGKCGHDRAHHGRLNVGGDKRFHRLCFLPITQLRRPLMRFRRFRRCVLH